MPLPKKYSIGQSNGFVTFRGYLPKRRCTLLCRCGTVYTAERKNWENNRGCSKTCRLSDSDAGFRCLFRSYRANAKKRRLSWELSGEEAFLLFSQACWYCGAAPSKVRSRENRCNVAEDLGFVHNGIDRIDSALGYLLSNCRSCCQQCNYAKHVYSEWEFIAWLRQVTYNLSTKGLIQ